MQQVVVLFGGKRWGKEYIADMIRAAGATILWPEDVPQAGFSITCVIALDDFVAADAVALAAAHGVPFYPMESHQATFEKHRLRELWNQLVAAHPDWPLAAVPYQLIKPNETCKTQWNYPVIIKPNAYSGSVGVELVESAGALTTAIYRLRKTLAHETSRFTGDFAVCPDILLEEAIPRKEIPNSCAEYTLHMLSRQGEHYLLATAEKQLDPHSYIEVGHTVPAQTLPEALLPAMRKANEWLLSNLQVEQCISNWEYIVTPDNQLALVEGQLRPSGDRLMQLIQMATGINPFEALFTGHVAPTQNRTAAIRWLGPKEIEINGNDITIPDLPDGWEVMINREALLQNPNWPGPVDWYNRHVAVVGHF